MPLADLGDISLYYQRRGNGPPALGVMGFALDHRFWASAIPAVTPTHEFITFDNRGVGRSTGAIPSTFDEMANDAVRLLDHLEIEKAVVFGVSMGGAVAQRIVLDHPERVSALILGITFGRPIEFMRRQHEVARVLAREIGPELMMDASLLRMFTPEFFEMGRENIDRMVAAFLVDEEATPDQEVLIAQLDALDKHDALEELRSVAVPTLVFGARNDQMVPGFASVELAEAIPGARLQMFDSGHGVMVEHMEAVNGLVSDFLASL
jgi:pimeloyl-ACP methyl ester carboxylesterase